MCIKGIVTSTPMQFVQFARPLLFAYKIIVSIYVFVDFAQNFKGFIVFSIVTHEFHSYMINLKLQESNQAIQ